MTAAPATAPAYQPRVDPLDEAEALVLAFAGVLLGNDGRGAGLLTKRVNGRFHTRGCQVGMWLRPGRGPEGCSDRCESAREALDAATRWLRAREAVR